MLYLYNTNLSATTLANDYARLKEFEDHINQTHKELLTTFLNEEAKILSQIQSLYTYLDEHIEKIGLKEEPLKAPEEVEDFSAMLEPFVLSAYGFNALPDPLSVYNLPEKVALELTAYRKKVINRLSHILNDLDMMNAEIHKLHQKVKEATGYFELIADLMAKDYIPMQLVKDARDHLYVLAALVNGNYYIKLGLYATRTSTRLLDYLHATIRNPRIVNIDDIWVEEYDRNLEHGSLLLSTFLDIVQERGFAKVTGRLTQKDADHFDSLQHFFKTHGFKVTFTSKTSGAIQKYSHAPLYFNGQ